MNVKQLTDAIAALDEADALQCKLTVDEWKTLAPYLTIRFLRQGEVLMAEGELEITISGHLFTTLRPGSVVGEGTFFSGQPRSATVTPSRQGVAWSLSWEKFDQITQKHPTLAVDLIKGLAMVLAMRMREAILVGQFT